MIQVMATRGRACAATLNSTQENNQLYHNHRAGNVRLIPIQIEVQVRKQSRENGAGLRAAEEENVIDRNGVRYRIIGTRLEHVSHYNLVYTYIYIHTHTYIHTVFNRVIFALSFLVWPLKKRGV